ncbi:ROK family protein [Prauserella muralis]|uniref:Transcriptional regulator n=1 Tax=Prauserella muralis TaxID=588067 RepID=A0A2V4AGE1_9PSEU|nr:ROK family protein [Prauserella muralis]PXY18995.1 transcriptional regulator [Prauserella muralis]TWE28887.1 putative NBD/HSP70 family sugar kinase [Prauserella muralis]
MRRDAPARPVQQHEHNLALVARLAARAGPVSRAWLAQQSGLTKSTVTQLTGELVEGGLLRELGTGRAGGPGRPATLLELNALGPAAIGLQVEADHVAGCLTDLTGRVRDRAIRRAGDLRGEPGLAVRAAEPVLRRLLNTALSTDSVVAGIAVGLPGRVSRTGTVTSAGLGWQGTDLARLLGTRLAVLGGSGIPVTVRASARLAALAEAWFGGEQDAEVLVCVSGEQGLGAGILLDGTVLEGARGAAGDIGHVRVRASGGEPCECGAAGCLDTVAGQTALLRAAGVTEPARSRLAAGEGPLPALVREGERRAVTATRRAGTALGGALGGLASALDPDVIVLGGYLAGLGPRFAEWVGAALGQRCPGFAPSVRVRLSRLPADIVARAAAATVTRGLVDDPARWLAE